MKLMSKLLISFLGVAVIVLVAGILGIYSATTIGRNADLILDEKVPAKDVSMEAIISVISARDASAEYLLNTEGLAEIGDEIEEFIGDFDMWIAMVKYGTESPEFKNSAAGQMYVADGVDVTMPKGTPEMIFLAEEADKYHEEFTQASRALVESRNLELASYAELDQEMASYDSGFAAIEATLATLETDRSEWGEAETAMNFRVNLAKQKGIVEEYAGFTSADSATQEQFREEFASLIPDYLAESQYFSATVKAQYTAFLGAAQNVFDAKDLALSSANTTMSYMVTLDAVSEKAEESLGRLEMLADSEMLQSMEQANATEKFTFALLIVVVVVGFVLALGIGIILALKISRPLRAATGIAEKIADGDFTAEKMKVKTKDEIGMLANSFSKMNASLNDLLGQVNEAIEQVASGSDQVAQSSQSLSQGATEQASSLEEISSSLNEINAQARSNVENADSGNQQMQELVTAMQKINESSDAIKKVVKTIDDIAFQINLLALNANVEAARAGKYGKGFAVVAEEVRNLAMRSTAAVKETTQMVDDTVKNIETGNELAASTAKQLEAMASSSKEQAQGVEQINSGLEQIDQVTQSNTANAEESASAAEELTSQAQQLKSTIDKFKLKQNGSRKIGQPTTETIGPSHDDTEDGNGNGKKATPVLAGAANAEPANPKKVIKLDDKDFGKF